MNLSNIKAGQTFKNYKELCSVLGEKVMAGNSKKAQLKEWERYFSYTKDGHKFIITEIYNEPKERDDKRILGNNAAYYIDYIEILLLNLFAEYAEQEQRTLLLSKSKLLYLLKMINTNYLFYRDKTNKLSEYINISEEEIKDFYESSNNTLTSNIETALRRLRQQSLAHWSYVTAICYLDSQIEINELGKVKVKRYKKPIYNDQEIEGEQYIYEPSNPTKPVHRYKKANDEEIELIMETEKEILEKYGIDTTNYYKEATKQEKEKKYYIRELYKKGLANKFYKEVNDILFERANILYYYDAYYIVLNRKYINRDKELIHNKLEVMQKAIYEELLNNAVKERIIENAEKRHQKAKEIDDIFFDFNYFPENKNELLLARRNEKYIENTKTLTETLIDKDKKRLDHKF
ncbi:Uncharacterised protein [[Flavobacterium] thermophilum]|nr:Uncharacterised protein [[Flavobacterium] thermophilum]